MQFYCGSIMSMKQMLAIIVIFVFLAMDMAAVAGMHHGAFDSLSCAAICLGAMHPLATAALIAVIVLFFAVFESFSVSFPHFSSEHFNTFRYSLFRTQFTRWFSLLEHSPTA